MTIINTQTHRTIAILIEVPSHSVFFLNNRTQETRNKTSAINFLGNFVHFEWDKEWLTRHNNPKKITSNTHTYTHSGHSCYKRVIETRKNTLAVQSIPIKYLYIFVGKDRLSACCNCAFEFRWVTIALIFFLDRIPPHFFIHIAVFH